MQIYDYTVKDRKGNVVERFESTIVPEKMEAKIKELI